MTRCRALCATSFVIAFALSACSEAVPSATDSSGAAGAAGSSGASPARHAAVGGSGGGDGSPLAPAVGDLAVDCGELPSLELTNGCGDAQVRTRLCLEEPQGLTYGACIRRIATGEVYFASGSMLPESNWIAVSNPLAAVPGFAPCTEAETDAGFCATEDVPVRQVVTLQITNTSTAPRHLVVGGSMCNPLGVERLEADTWLSLPLSVDGPTCECTHSCDGGPTLQTVEVAPGETYELGWDARVAELVDRWIACGAAYMCSSGTCDAHFPDAILRPASAGTYRLTVGVQDGPCDAGIYSDACAAAWIFPGVHDVCPASTLRSVEFELPDTGDVTIALALE